MNLDKLQIWCSPMTGRIYVGHVLNGSAINKVDVTQQVINSVMMHMDVTKKEYESQAGDLVFNSRGNKSSIS